MRTKRQGHFAVDELLRVLTQGVNDCHKQDGPIWRASPSHYQDVAECLVNLSRFDRDIAIEFISGIIPFIEGTPTMRGIFAHNRDTDQHNFSQQC